MKRKTLHYLIFLPLLALLVMIPAPAQSATQLTRTLLPVKESGATAENYLWAQSSPGKAIFLQFDLNALPSGLPKTAFTRCTLRLVARNVVYQPSDDPNTGAQKVIVKGWLADDAMTRAVGTKSIIALSTISKAQPVALKASDSLLSAVSEAYTSEKKLLSLALVTETNKASSLFYSTKQSGDAPSNIPRLVIEYTPGSPSLLETLGWPQHQQNPEHTGRSEWIPFKNPSGFTLATIELQKGSIADYPLIHRGNLYIVHKVEAADFLVALDFKGKELWRKDIGTGVVQRSPVISRNGIFYVVTENSIAGYDLNRSGQQVAVYPQQGNLPGSLSAYTDLTMGNDGSLFLALKEGDANYLYGFTPDLKPFLKSGPFSTGQEKISTITVSPEGRTIFFQTPKGAVTIDITDPAKERIVALKQDNVPPWEYYHTPVAGPAGGVMVFSDFTSSANKGNVWAYTPDEKRIWNAPGTLIPQPVLGSNGGVYYLQNGALQRHQYDRLGKGEDPVGKGLNTTSNMVMDGADNVYFWDNGYLYGYSSSGKSLFDKADFTNGPELEKKRSTDPEEVSAGKKAPRVAASMGPEQFIRLMAGPDGTLWANNKNGSTLFAFTPNVAEQGLELTQQDMKTRTVYRTSGTLTVGAVTLEPGSQMLFQARKGMAFSRGFRVQNGASLLCRTGF